jgi:hypothetical protein
MYIPRDTGQSVPWAVTFKRVLPASFLKASFQFKTYVVANMSRTGHGNVGKAGSGPRIISTAFTTPENISKG